MDAIAIPDKPMTLDEVIEKWPVLRQSILSTYDDCSLSSYFEILFDQGWSTHPQAAGTIFHRFAAECLRTMRRVDSKSIPPGEALAIMEEVLEQRDIEPHERQRIPFRETKLLRTAALKFAKDNTFGVRRITDIEKRLNADIEYVDDDGQIRTRTLTGQPDSLISHATERGHVIIIDWKKTWALPPERDVNDTEKPGLSYHGFFQQRFYGWLVMKNYPNVEKVTLREFYVLRTAARPATITRAQMPEIETDLRNLVRDFDRSLMGGKPKRLKLGKDLGGWQPSPGPKHCGYCSASQRCPIPKMRRELIVVRTPEQASEAVAMLAVAEGISKNVREAVRPWCEENGPVIAKNSKGDQVFGLRTDKNGKPSLTFFAPKKDIDKPIPSSPQDKPLIEAMRKAGEHAKADREAVKSEHTE